MTCSASGCNQCLSNMVLASNATCVATCSSGTFRNATTGVCDTCSSNCAECSDTAGSCTVCNAGHALYHKGCYNQTSIPAGQFWNASSSQVESCHASCRTCNDSSPTSCTSCASFAPILNNGMCSTACANGTFAKYNATTSLVTCIGIRREVE